jgi:hypothetical protein
MEATMKIVYFMDVASCLVKTDVLEQRFASIFTVKNWREKKKLNAFRQILPDVLLEPSYNKIQKK